MGKVIKSFTHIYDTARTIIELSDSVYRFAEYRRNRKAGKTVLDSQYEAARVSVDFSKGGIATKKLDNIVLYLNSSITSVYQDIQALTTDSSLYGKRQVIASWMKLLGTMALGAVTFRAFSALLAIMFDTDPDEVKEAYENVSAYQKNNNWLLYIPRKKSLSSSQSLMTSEYSARYCKE